MRGTERDDDEWMKSKINANIVTFCEIYIPERLTSMAVQVGIIVGGTGDEDDRKGKGKRCTGERRQLQ